MTDYILLIKGKGIGCDYAPVGCNRNWESIKAESDEEAIEKAKEFYEEEYVEKMLLFRVSPVDINP